MSSTSIHDAADSGDLEMVRSLIQDDPNQVFGKDDANSATALHFAAGGGFSEVAELLLKNNADVNAMDANGMTPLHWAADKAHKNVVEVLLRNEAEVNAKDDFGSTPLRYASGDVAELLRRHGGNMGGVRIVSHQ